MPLTVIAEVLGQPASSMRDPVSVAYGCPFIGTTCAKKSHQNTDPYPVCTIFKSKKLQLPICVCPKRFYEADLVKDIVAHAWIGKKPKNQRVAYEVKMAGFGMVDLVVADVDPTTNSVRKFISAELQAVDITGSYTEAYNALLFGKTLRHRPSYGFNWANVRKRYVSQLIAKAFFHHHWGTRMVAALQTDLFDQFRKFIPFDMHENPGEESNIVFLLYKYVDAPEKGVGGLKLELDRVVGTSHNSLMMAQLYRKVPDKSEFCQKIIDKLQ